DTNIRRIGYVAKLLARNGVVAITAAISPYREIRDEVRRSHNRFVEVYAKGLYKKALKGEIPFFTGISDPYEEPLNPELVVETDREGPEESLKRVLSKLEALNYIYRKSR